MIRDLQYPEDARRLTDSLIHELEYDAAFAVLGNSLKDVPQPNGQPDFSTGIRFGGKEADRSVRRDAPGLCSRFALISMVSRFERFTELLLLQRRVLEELKTEGVKMTRQKMWAILKGIHKDIRRLSSAQVTLQLLVANPSKELKSRTDWLVGINRVRNCLAHRLGIVQMEDVKTPGLSIEDVKDTDTLKVNCIRLKASVDDEEIKSFPHKANGDGKSRTRVDVQFEEYEREWKIGEVIHMTPLECQGIGMSLALLGNQVLAELEIDINSSLMKHKTAKTL
jgi:hypothetical protein